MRGKSILLTTAAALFATGAWAIDVDFGGLNASVDVDLNDGISVDADVNLNQTSVDANVNVGPQNGISTDVAVNTGPSGSAPSTSPGTGGVPGVSPGTQGIPAGALVARGNYTGLVGHWLYSSDGERLGRIVSVKGYDGRWLSMQVRLDPALGLGERDVIVSVRPRETWGDNVQTQMSAFRFVRHLEKVI